MSALDGGLLTTAQLAELLQVPPRTIDDWAYRGTGPRYSRVGKARRYLLRDVERWLDEHASEPAVPVRRLRGVS